MKKIVMVIILIAIMLFSVKTVKADLISDIIEQGNNFEKGGDNDTGLGSDIAGFITGDVKRLISLIGNLVFAVTTVILGAKYIWSGFEGKSNVKETLPGFVTAVIFFYLATEITALFSVKTQGSIGNTLSSIRNYRSLSGMILATVNLIVKYLSFAGIVFIGVKYMFASAENRAKIKDKLVPMVLGIVLVFSASSFVDFIISVGEQTIK